MYYFSEMKNGSLMTKIIPVRNAHIPKPLTWMSIKKLPEGFSPDTYPHQGLRVGANKNGTKAWLYRYRVGTKLRQVKLGIYPSVDLSEAREVYTESRTLKNKGVDLRVIPLD
ncbi:MAG: hypothetical protein ACI9GE_000344 [Oceanospirillaceae bacterium]